MRPDHDYKESGIDKAATLISAIGGLMNGSVPQPPGGPGSGLANFDKGGTVPKDELAVVHKGEQVLPLKEASIYRAVHHLRRGGLHKALGADPTQPVSKELIEKGKTSKNKHVALMSHLAGAE